jgi:hypothetical protein
MRKAITIVWLLFVLMVSFDLLHGAAIGNIGDVSDNPSAEKNATAIQGREYCCGPCIYKFNPTCGCPCVGDFGFCCQWKF